MQKAALDFQQDVIAASQEKPVVVDFWAEWCAPCRILGPVLEKLAGEANGAWELVKINTEVHPQVAVQYGIRSIPAVKMFYQGEVIAEFVGALPEVQVRRWLEQNIPTRGKKILEQANAALTAGDRSRGAELLRQAIQEDEENFEARILLAELILESEPEKAGRLVQETPEEHPLYNRAEAVRTLVSLSADYENLARQAENTDGSEARAWSLYLQGIQALRQQNYEAALQNWIEGVAVNRNIAEDGLRRACVSLFTWLGQNHELTRKYQRAFTSALF